MFAEVCPCFADSEMGTFYGKGVNEGAIVWEGPLGGIFLYNKNGNRSQVANIMVYLTHRKRENAKINLRVSKVHREL